MKKEDIHLDDWQRIILGSAPVEFMAEVFLRSVLIYVAAVVVARLLGKRMNGQLTPVEMAVMLTLGAIIAPIMQLPDRGVLLGILALVCALVFQRGINLLAFKNSRVEEVLQGIESVLIKDGILQLDAMQANRISKQQVFAYLRGQNIYNVSKVKRMYIEACGLFSIYTEPDDKPGLSVLPATDPEVQTIQKSAGDQVVACPNCGNTIPIEQEQHVCPVCKEKEWVAAVC